MCSEELTPRFAWQVCSKGIPQVNAGENRLPATIAKYCKHFLTKGFFHRVKGWTSEKFVRLRCRPLQQSCDTIQWGYIALHKWVGIVLKVAEAKCKLAGDEQNLVTQSNEMVKMKTCGNTVYGIFMILRRCVATNSRTTSSLLSDNPLKYMMKTGVVDQISFRSFTSWMPHGIDQVGTLDWYQYCTRWNWNQNVTAWLHLRDWRWEVSSTSQTFQFYVYIIINQF